MASHKAYLPFVSSPVARKRYTSLSTATVRPWAGLWMIGFIRFVPLPFRKSKRMLAGFHLQPHDLIGARLAATLAYLAGSHHVSKRGLEEICADDFDVPLSLGTLAHLETQISEALAQPHAEAVQAVRAAEVKNVDETSWKVARHRSAASRVAVGVPLR